MIEFLRNLPCKTYLGLFLCSLFATYWLVPKVVWLARGLGLFARANSKGGHTPPTLGGLALGIPFIAGISLLLLLRNQVSENMYMVPLQMRGLFLCSCLILALGFFQDLLNLIWYLRVALQIIVAATAYYYGFRLEALPGAEGAISALGPLVFTLLWIVGLINLFDLFNRSNHLCRLFINFALLLIFSLLAVAYLLDQYRTIVVCCLLIGSLLGFVSYDSRLRPNLGSTGACFLGFVLAITTLQGHIVDDLSGFFLFALGAGLLAFLFVLKLPSHLPALADYRGNIYLHAQSLYHFKTAFSLRIETATDQEEAWSHLCRAATEFNYLRLVQRSSTGEQERDWSIPGNTGQTSTFPMRRSGGILLAQCAAEGFNSIPAESHYLFGAIVDIFDYRQEKAILAEVEQRKNSQRVLLINRYFSGMSATGQILSDLAEDLTLSGAAVTVLTGGLSYETAMPLPGRNELARGIHIYRVPATHFGRTNALNRAMDFGFFYAFSLGWVLKTPSQRYTHVIGFTDPPLVAITGYTAKKIKKWKFIYGVQDLYPETALALGILKAGWFFNLCDRINRTLLREADAVVAIGQKMAAHIRSIVDSPQHLEVIPNWADGRKILPVGCSAQTLAATLKLKNVYTVIYAGNMGLAQEIDALIQLLRALRDRQDIQFLFMGGGVRRRDLEAAVIRYQIENAKFINYQERASLAAYLSLADIGIVTLSPALEGLAIPTRTYSYWAAGLPILAISGQSSELKDYAEQGLGVHFTPDAIEEIAEYLDAEIKRGRRRRDPQIRQHFLMHYDRQGQTGRYLTLLRKLQED